VFLGNSSLAGARLILLSTNDLPEAEEICDSFIFIDSGRIVARGGREELPGAGRESLKEAFFEAMRRSGTMTDAS
ncbi:MAG: hypothetical protein ACE5GW_06350, partial [Planctomycetota bacterium]